MVNFIAQTFFWISIATLFYVYAGYPLFVWIYSKIFLKIVKRGEIEPFVTVLITAYNEEKDIKRKLENTLEIDYPKGKLEILVASDGSTDKTDEIVRSFAGKGIKLFRQEGRKGKTYTQNKAVEQSNGEIILFSDATTVYRKDVLREILPNFADEKIGCAAGKLVYVDETDSNVGAGAKGYWNYETFLKQAESDACSIIGASGCLYAVRKSAYQPMYDESCSDFLICTVIYRQNLRSVFEPRAVCFEDTNRRTDKEMRMRIRIISQTFTDLWRNRDMLNPLKSGFYGVQLISHKLFRYAVPVFLFFLLISTAILSFYSNIFSLIFAVQIAFYLLAFLGWITNLKILAIPYYFVLTNIASIVAFYKFLRGEKFARWEPIREITDNG